MPGSYSVRIASSRTTPARESGSPGRAIPCGQNRRLLHQDCLRASIAAPPARHGRCWGWRCRSHRCATSRESPRASRSPTSLRTSPPVRQHEAGLASRRRRYGCRDRGHGIRERCGYPARADGRDADGEFCSFTDAASLQAGAVEHWAPCVPLAASAAHSAHRESSLLQRTQDSLLVRLSGTGADCRRPEIDR